MCVFVEVYAAVMMSYQQERHKFQGFSTDPQAPTVAGIVSLADHQGWRHGIFFSYFLLFRKIPERLPLSLPVPCHDAIPHVILGGFSESIQEFLTSVIYIVAFAVMIVVLAEIPSTQNNGDLRDLFSLVIFGELFV